MNLSFSLISLFIVSIASSQNNQNHVLIDVESKYGISFEGLTKAIQEAQSVFAKDEESIVTIFIAKGIHHLMYPDYNSSLDLTGPQPGRKGRLIIEGAGMHDTVIVTDNWHNTIVGRGVRKLTVRNIHFTRDRHVTTQGIVTSVGAGFVTLNISNEFPSVESIFNWRSKTGRYLRKYENVDGKCVIVEAKNKQVDWMSFKTHENNEKTIFLLDNNFTPNYKVGDLIGVKSKCCGHSHNAYSFCEGDY